MDGLNEALLDAWLGVTSSVNNDRIVKYLSYNEAYVCNLLWKQKQKSEEYLTPTKLCEMTHMISSLMNRTLNSLEAQGLIERVRSKVDKRIVYVRLCEAGEELFIKEHQRSISIIDSMIEKVGEENAQKILESLILIYDAAHEVILERKKQ